MNRSNDEHKKVGENLGLSLTTMIWLLATKMERRPRVDAPLEIAIFYILPF